MILVEKLTHFYSFMKSKLKEAGVFLLGGIVIIAIFFVCEYVMGWLGLKFPPSLVAMLTLFFLLQFKIIPLWWVEKTGEFLLKYVVLFFVPILVVLPDSYQIVKNHLWAIVIGIGLGGALTLITTAVAVEKLHKYRNSKGEHVNEN